MGGLSARLGPVVLLAALVLQAVPAGSSLDVAGDGFVLASRYPVEVSFALGCCGGLLLQGVVHADESTGFIAFAGGDGARAWMLETPLEGHSSKPRGLLDLGGGRLLAYGTLGDRPALFIFKVDGDGVEVEGARVLSAVRLDEEREVVFGEVLGAWRHEGGGVVLALSAAGARLILVLDDDLDVERLFAVRVLGVKYRHADVDIVAPLGGGEALLVGNDYSGRDASLLLARLRLEPGNYSGVIVTVPGLDLEPEAVAAAGGAVYVGGGITHIESYDERVFLAKLGGGLDVEYLRQIQLKRITNLAAMTPVEGGILVGFHSEAVGAWRSVPLYLVAVADDGRVLEGYKVDAGMMVRSVNPKILEVAGSRVVVAGTIGGVDLAPGLPSPMPAAFALPWPPRGNYTLNIEAGGRGTIWYRVTALDADGLKRVEKGIVDITNYTVSEVRVSLEELDPDSVNFEDVDASLKSLNVEYYKATLVPQQGEAATTKPPAGETTATPQKTPTYTTAGETSTAQATTKPAATGATGAAGEGSPGAGAVAAAVIVALAAAAAALALKRR